MQPTKGNSSTNLNRDSSVKAPSRSNPATRYIPETSKINPARRIESRPADKVDPLSIFSEEVQQEIFGYLSIEELTHCSRVSKQWLIASQKAIVEVFRDSKYILEDEKIIEQLSCQIRKFPDLQRQLLAIVKASHQNAALAEISAIIMSLLVEAGICFSNMDLEGIRIAGARLEGGMFDGTNLRNADLRRTRLHAWLRNANLEGSQLEGADFGQSQPGRSKRYSPQFESPSLTATIAGGSYPDPYIIEIRNESYTLLHKLECDTNYIEVIEFSDDQKLLASSSGNMIIRIWDVEKGKCFHSFLHDSYAKHSSRASICSLKFSPSKKYLIGGDTHNSIEIWPVEYNAHGRRFNKIRVHDKVHRGDETVVTSFAFSADEALLAASGTYEKDTVVTVYRTHSLPNTYRLHTMRGHSDQVVDLAFSSDGKFLASASVDRTIRIWDCQNGECLFIIPIATQYISGLKLQFDDHNRQLICKDAFAVLCWKIDWEAQSFQLRSSTMPVLNCENINITGVVDISDSNLKLLRKQGAIGEPASAKPGPNIKGENPTPPSINITKI